MGESNTLTSNSPGFLSECMSVIGRLLVTKWSKYVATSVHTTTPNIKEKKRKMTQKKTKGNYAILTI